MCNNYFFLLASLLALLGAGVIMSRSAVIYAVYHCDMVDDMKKYGSTGEFSVFPVIYRILTAH